MYQVFCEKSFAAAHSLRDYNGICENTHGHNWLVRVHVCSAELDESGFVMDFDHLKEMLEFITRDYDHKDLNLVPPFNELNPTSENLAKYICDHVSKNFIDTPISVSKVEVYEQNDACAAYIPPAK